MTAVQNVLGRQIAAVSIVDAYIMVIVVIAIAVDQYDRDPALLHLLVEGIRIHADDNDPVQIALLCQGQIALVGIRSRDDHMVAFLSGAQFNASQYLRVKLVLKHESASSLGLRDHYADQPGILSGAAQGTGCHVWCITQPLDGLLDPPACLLGNRALPAQCIRDGRAGDASLFGDIPHGDPIGRHAIPPRLI